MARLILIRHGESVANAERRFTVGPHEPLTETGRLEADTAGRFVASGFAPIALYASPFARARETAERVGRAVGLVPVVIENLREQFFGELHGRPYADYRRDPAAEGLGAWDVRPPGGESLREVAERAGPELDALALRHAGRDVVVVSHGAVMAALRGWSQRDLASPPQPTRNACGYILEHAAAAYGAPRAFSLDDVAAEAESA